MLFRYLHAQITHLLMRCFLNFSSMASRCDEQLFTSEAIFSLICHFHRATICFDHTTHECGCLHGILDKPKYILIAILSQGRFIIYLRHGYSFLDGFQLHSHITSLWCDIFDWRFESRGSTLMTILSKTVKYYYFAMPLLTLRWIPHFWAARFIFRFDAYIYAIFICRQSARTAAAAVSNMVFKGSVVIYYAGYWCFSRFIDSYFHRAYFR